jgi:cupin 2 domain-containing protein
MGRSDRATGNLLRDLPEPQADETFETLLERPGVRVERIVSYGHVTPVNSPQVQAHDEWVLVATGSARLTMEDAGERLLEVGDYVCIPAGTGHRVTWTDPAVPTVWLALHFEPGCSPA